MLICIVCFLTRLFDCILFLIGSMYILAGTKYLICTPETLDHLPPPPIFLLAGSYTVPGEKLSDEESGSVRAPVGAEMVERRPPSPVTTDVESSPQKPVSTQSQLAVEKRVATNEVIQL